MLSIILSLHQYFFGINDRNIKLRKKHSLVSYVICNGMVRLCVGMLELYMWIYKALNLYPSPLRGREDVVVSLTTFPKRINKVWMVIDSMFRQKDQPSKIVLYLINEEFPEGKKALPKRLLGYEKIGLEIRFRDINLKPHNKYFYALQEFPDKNVVTIDDDYYYNRKHISNLLEVHRKYPDCVCANFIDVMTLDEKGIKPYSEWICSVGEVEPNPLNVAMGFNAVLYPAWLFRDARQMFDINLIRNLSLNADDLWLKVLETVYGIDVVAGDYVSQGLLLMGTQSVTLMSTNCGEKKENDVYWKKMNDYFKIEEKLLERVRNECTHPCKNTGVVQGA